MPDEITTEETEQPTSTGWGPPAEAAETQEGGTEPAEAAEAQETAETERLYAGKYKTAEDLERAYQEAQQALGRQGEELGRYRQMAEQRQTEPARPDPLTEQIAQLEAAVNMLPSEIKQHAQYKDMPEMDIVRLQMRWERQLDALRSQQSEEAQQAQYQQQAYEQQMALKQQADAVEARIYQDHPDFQGWEFVVEQTAGELWRQLQSGQAQYGTWDDFGKAVAEEADKRIVSLASTVLGRRGGQASAQQRRTPPAVTPPGTAPTFGQQPSPQTGQGPGWAPYR